MGTTLPKITAKPSNLHISLTSVPFAQPLSDNTNCSKIMSIQHTVVAEKCLKINRWEQQQIDNHKKRYQEDHLKYPMKLQSSLKAKILKPTNQSRWYLSLYPRKNLRLRMQTSLNWMMKKKKLTMLRKMVARKSETEITKVPARKMTNLPKLQVQILLVKKVWKRYETMMRPKKKMMIENPVDYFLQIHSVLESRRKTSLYFVVFFLQNSQNNLFDD